MKRTSVQATFAVVSLTALAMFAASSALAQTPGGPPNALQGFSQNRDKPVKIDAASLEVRDKDKIATFLGNVQVVQGDTTLKCKTLVVFYDQGDSGNTLTAANPGPGGQQRIKRLEARGNVIVTQKDQTATGENGIYDMASNSVTLIGNVIVTQGQNVVKGDRLVVDLTSGVSHVECGKSSQCRVQALFLPSSSQELKGEQGNKDSSQGGKDAPKSKSMRPSGLY
jgi:lipopolysaccharide export system protein LptA